MAIKVGQVNIQFDKEWDPVKANQLVLSLQKLTSAVQTLAGTAASATTTTPTTFLLASQAGLGPTVTVAGLEAGQVLTATGAETAAFATLQVGQLEGFDYNSFAAPLQGDLIMFNNGYWSAVSNSQSLGLQNPGADSLVMWDKSANAGAGGLTWVVGGTGITLATGSISVNVAPLVSPLLTALLEDPSFPDYALVSQVPLLASANAYAGYQTFDVGFASLFDIAVGGNVEQIGLEGIEDRIQNSDDQANEGTWRFHAEPGQIMYASVSDPDPGYTVGSDGENWLTVTREGETVDQVNVQGNSFSFNGWDVCTGSVQAGVGNIPAKLAGRLTMLVAGQTIIIPYLEA